MKIAVCGGKGGTGKTLIAASLAKALLPSSVVYVDADVDNPCSLYFFREGRMKWKRTFYEFRPMISEDRCIKCGKCVENCPENALFMIPGMVPELIPNLCSGCGVCFLLCPEGAIYEGKSPEGRAELYEMGNIKLLVGFLREGSRRTAVAISRLIRLAEEIEAEHHLYDSPPGSGAKLFPILENSEKALVISEPTPLGLSDTRKFLKLASKAGPQLYLVINKAGISEKYERELKKLARSWGIETFCIPYSEKIQRLYSKGITLYDSEDFREYVEEILKAIR